MSPYEASILRDAFKDIKRGATKFTSSMQSSLLTTLSRFGLRKIPMPDSLKSLLAQSARFEFLLKPSCIISSIFSGIPSKHKAFWDDLGVNGILSLYNTLSVSPAKVFSLLADVEIADPNQDRVFTYLRQYIASMDGDELRRFLRFVTGSTVCMSKKITVNFNNTTGMARRPIAHTCDPSLELSSSFDTYLEFVNELRAYLLDESSWIMDAL